MKMENSGIVSFSITIQGGSSETNCRWNGSIYGGIQSHFRLNFQWEDIHACTACQYFFSDAPLLAQLLKYTGAHNVGIIYLISCNDCDNYDISFIENVSYLLRSKLVDLQLRLRRLINNNRRRCDLLANKTTGVPFQASNMKNIGPI